MMQKIAVCAPSHNFVRLSGYTFAIKAHIDSRKKLLNSNISSTCPYNIVNFGPVTAEIGSLVWGNHANFNGFRVLAALLHSTLVWASTKVCGVEQRATTTLGIGPHSIVSFFSGTCSSCDRVSQEPNSDCQKREHQATVWSRCR